MNARRTRLKVCCISSIAEAELAINTGADAVGLVGKMPSGPGQIADELITEIARVVPPPVSAFLLTSETEPGAVVEHVRRTGVDTVQLVDDSIGVDVYKQLRKECPSTRIVQVIHVCSSESVALALSRVKFVDALLLDSGNPRATTAELGGTGRVHNWSLSREIVNESDRPVFLAGGIKPENVARAIREVEPFGIDICSGVRENGELCSERLSSLVRALK